MKARFGIVAIVLGVCLLFTGALALATDFVWDGDGPLLGEEELALWTGPFHWDQGSGYPDDANDNATITDPDPSSTCTYSPSSGLTINDLTLGGASPTKMKLHIKDQSLITYELLLQDYAELDADANLSVLQHTEISGSVWIDVATGVVVNLLASGQNHPAMHVESAQARLNLTTTGTAVVSTAGILIDADAANASRGLKLNGGTLTLGSFSEIGIKSDPDADNKRAKFWLATGSIAASDFGTYVEMEGGGSAARRAELDLDQDLAMGTNVGYPGFIVIEGYASIDIAAGKKFTAPTLTIGDAAGNLAAVVKLTGASGAAIEIGF